jgi:histidine triad (HIT) family protein
MTSEIDHCLFCGLVAGGGDTSVVNEDARTITLMDIQPVTVGHMLVIPKVHAAYLADLEPKDGAQMFRIGQLAAASLRNSGLRCDGVNFFLADGEAAGQEVFHVHLHVFPRFTGDGFGLQMPHNYAMQPRSDLDSVAATLRHAWPTPG